MFIVRSVYRDRTKSFLKRFKTEVKFKKKWFIFGGCAGNNVIESLKLILRNKKISIGKPVLEKDASIDGRRDASSTRPNIIIKVAANCYQYTLIDAGS